jgi:hypothetical protein
MRVPSPGLAFRFVGAVGLLLGEAGSGSSSQIEWEVHVPSWFLLSEWAVPRSDFPDVVVYFTAGSGLWRQSSHDGGCSWQDPEFLLGPDDLRIGDPVVSRARFPAMALTGAEGIWVTWIRGDGATDPVRVVLDGVDTPYPVALGSSSSATVVVAMAPTDTVYATCTYDEGSSWSPPISLGRGTRHPGSIRPASIASTNGGFVVAFVDEWDDVRIVRSLDGQAWDLVSVIDSTDPWSLDLAVRPDGSAMVAWDDWLPDGARGIRYSTADRFGDPAAWSPPRTAMGRLEGSMIYLTPSVGVDEGGSWSIAACHIRAVFDTRGKIHYSTLMGNGEWTPPWDIGAERFEYVEVDLWIAKYGHTYEQGVPRIVAGYLEGAVVMIEAPCLEAHAGSIEVRPRSRSVGSSLAIEVSFGEPMLGQASLYDVTGRSVWRSGRRRYYRSPVVFRAPASASLGSGVYWWLVETDQGTTSLRQVLLE